MTRSEMMTELLEVVNDSTTNGIWTPATLLGYLAEGQDKFCEKTGYFTDISNFTLELTDGVAVYAIPDRIIQLLDIWNGTKKLRKLQMDEVIETSEDGVPSMWRTDQETGIIKVYPTPTSAEDGDTLVLQVWRYSQYDLAEDSRAPEIPSRFHRACIEWAAYKAFMHHDMETQDPVKAADHLASFNMYAKDGIRALRRYQNQETRVGSDPAYRT